MPCYEAPRRRYTINNDESNRITQQKLAANAAADFEEEQGALAIELLCKIFKDYSKEQIQGIIGAWEWYKNHLLRDYKYATIFNNTTTDIIDKECKRLNLEIHEIIAPLLFDIGSQFLIKEKP